MEPRGGSAFPLQKPDGTDDHSGMDLHDWLTGVSLAGLLANPNSDVSKTAPLSDLVKRARHCADEILRNKAEE